MGERVAIVLSGAAARGAFQAGALAGLVPALVAAGHRPTVFLGTSAGAINASLWGSFADLDPEEAGTKLEDIWRSMDSSDVYAHPARTLLLSDGPRFLASMIGRGSGVSALLDTKPLQRHAATLLNSARLADNIRSGAVDAVGVTATRMPPTGVGLPLPPAAARGLRQAKAGRARTVVFVDAPTLPVENIADPVRSVDVATGPINVEQVLASAAIPIGFPPIHVDRPSDFGGWYVDGGVRLNAPLRPALALGADRIIVIDAMPSEAGAPLPSVPAGTSPPPAAEAAALMIHATLGDQVAEDIRELQSRNRMQTQARGSLTHGDGTKLRVIPMLVVSPTPGELGALAREVVDAKSRSPLGRWRDSDVLALNRLLQGLGNGPGREVLFSCLFFDSEYFSAQIEVGRRAAETALAQGWRITD